MTHDGALAEQFEAHRAHVRGVAYRMLGSVSDADDAVQEAWLRVSRAGTDGVANVGGWLTTVVSRVCLDALRTRKARREAPHDDAFDTPATQRCGDPAYEAALADSVGEAMLVVLETLSPAERVAFVLHDLFDVPFDEIAPVVGRTPAAARQLASRARRRVSGAAPSQPARREHREIVAAFLAASREGDFQTLLTLLDPNAVVRADAATVAFGASPEERGAENVARTFAGRAQAARPALIDGVPGLAWTPGGAPRVVFRFTFDRERIAAIDLIADRDTIAAFELTLE